MFKKPLIIGVIMITFAVSSYAPERISPEEKTLIDYFFENRTSSGLVLDRQSDPSTVSVASTGFAMDCWAIAYKKGIIDKATAITYINQALTNTLEANPSKNRGWLFHFTNPEGIPKPNCEVSSVDTAIFYSGALQASKRLQDQKLMSRIENLIHAVDIGWMMKNNLFSHGILWNNDQPMHLNPVWDTNSEGLLLYKLFNIDFKPVQHRCDLPLFVYYYPLCFYSDQKIIQTLHQAIDWQFRTYGYCGVTACDGPCGYQVQDTSVVSPVSLLAISKVSGKAKDFLSKLPVEKHTVGYDIKGVWKSNDKYGIDYGSALIMLNQK